MTRVLALLSKLSAYGLSILSRLVFTFIFLGERDLFFRCEFSASVIRQVLVANSRFLHKMSAAFRIFFLTAKA